MVIRTFVTLLMLICEILSVAAQDEEGDNCIDPSVEYPIDTALYRSWTEYKVDSNFAADLFSVEDHQPACARVADSVRALVDEYAGMQLHYSRNL